MPPFQCQALGASNVPPLAGLVATAQQHNYVCAPPNEVEPVSRPVMNPHLEDAIAYRVYIAEMSRSGSYQPDSDPILCPQVTEAVHPIPEGFALEYRDHAQSVFYSIHSVKSLEGNAENQCRLSGGFDIVGSGGGCGSSTRRLQDCVPKPSIPTSKKTPQPG